MVKVNDIVKVVHYESKFAGLLGEIREINGGAAYVEFNNAGGDSQDGQIINLSWLEWVYSPNGWKHPRNGIPNIEALDYLNQVYEMQHMEKDSYLHLHSLISGESDSEF